MLLTKQQKYLLAVLEKLGCAEQRQLAALLQKAFAFSSLDDAMRVTNACTRQMQMAPEKVDYRPLYEAIDHLPEKYRLAVILYYFDDRDIAATAQILGIPSGTVKSRLDKARKLLKEALGNETDL